jgi:hypothetical protein
LYETWSVEVEEKPVSVTRRLAFDGFGGVEKITRVIVPHATGFSEPALRDFMFSYLGYLDGLRYSADFNPTPLIPTLDGSFHDGLEYNFGNGITWRAELSTSGLSTPVAYRVRTFDSIMFFRSLELFNSYREQTGTAFDAPEQENVPGFFYRGVRRQVQNPFKDVTVRLSTAFENNPSDPDREDDKFDIFWRGGTVHGRGVLGADTIGLSAFYLNNISFSYVHGSNNANGSNGRGRKEAGLRTFIWADIGGEDVEPLYIYLRTPRLYVWYIMAIIMTAAATGGMYLLYRNKEKKEEGKEKIVNNTEANNAEGNNTESEQYRREQYRRE